MITGLLDSRLSLTPFALKSMINSSFILNFVKDQPACGTLIMQLIAKILIMMYSVEIRFNLPPRTFDRVERRMLSTFLRFKSNCTLCDISRKDCFSR